MTTAAVPTTRDTGPVRLLAALAAALLAMLSSAVVTVVAATPAQAHTDLLGSSPAAGEVVSTDTGELMLSFAEEVVPGTASVSVVGPDGQEATRGGATVEGALVRVGVDLATTGEHTAFYRVVAGDGHVVTGELTFDVATGATVPVVPAQAPTAAADDRRPDRVSWAVASSLVLLLLAGLHVARRRRLRPTVPDAQRSAGTPRTPESVSSAS